MQKSAAYNLGFTNGVKTASINQHVSGLGKSIAGLGPTGQKLLSLFGKGPKAHRSLGSAAAGIGGAGALMGLSDLLSPPENDPGIDFAQARRPLRLMGENPNIARSIMGYVY